MAQFPFKLSTASYASPAASPVSRNSMRRPSTDSDVFELPSPSPSFSPRGSTVNRKAIWSILHFFRSSKRKWMASPPSSRRYKLITCFSNVKHSPAVGFNEQAKWDTESSASDPARVSQAQASEEDDGKSRRNSSNDVASNDPGNVVGNNSSETSANEEEETKFHEIRCEDGGDTQKKWSLGDSEEVNLDHGSDDNVAEVDAETVSEEKTAKLPRDTNQPKGREEAKSVSGKQKANNKLRASSKRYQIWTKPIIMGKRCRKLDDGFPYGNGDGDEVVDDYCRASMSSVFSLVLHWDNGNKM